MNSRWLRNSFIYLLILVAIVAIVFTLFSKGGSSDQETTLTEFIREAQNGKVERVEVSGRNLKYFLTDDPNDQTFKTKMESGDTVRQVLQDAGIGAHLLEQTPRHTTYVPADNLHRCHPVLLPASGAGR